MTNGRPDLRNALILFSASSIPPAGTQEGNAKNCEYSCCAPLAFSMRVLTR